MEDAMRAEKETKNLIPGLPDEIAMECMLRVPYQYHSTLRCVSHTWRSFVSDPFFYHQRRKSGKAELLLCLLQPLKSPTKMSENRGELSGDEESLDHFCGMPRYQLGFYNATRGAWTKIRPIHGNPIPLFSETVALPGGKLMLLGGWDPDTLQPLPDVYIVELAGSRQVRTKRAAPMSVARSFFACAVVGGTKVYVAGGHDKHKNALQSAEVYDTENDQWEAIPPMEVGRDECQGVSIGDLGFCVMSGYRTENQGDFRTDAEVYDPSNRRWSKIENIWPFRDTTPRGRISSIASAMPDDEKKFNLWCLLSGDQQVHRRELVDADRKIKAVINPLQFAAQRSPFFAASLGSDRVIVMGGKQMPCSCGRGCRGLGVMMEKNGAGDVWNKWSHIHMPEEFSGLPFSASSFLL